MMSALGFDARLGAPRRVPLPPGDRYSIVGKLRGTGRAEVSLGLPAGARSVDELVVIKRYGSGAVDRDILPAEMPAEIEVASTPRHDNLVRVVECGWDASGHFIVSEYLEGTTLRRLLRWLEARAQKLPSAAVARILLGMFAAVEHANQWTRKPEARALVHQPIDASDVFITYAGSIKLLGFKPPRSRDASGSGVTPIEPAAVDDLLSSQRTPELTAALARIGNRVSAASLIGLWQVARMLREWQRDQLQSDGRAELADVLAALQPERRAMRRTQLDAAVARVLRARDESEPAGDAAPLSGYRAATSGDRLAPLIAPEPLAESSALPTLVVRGAEVVSHLPRGSLLGAPLPPPEPAQPRLAGHELRAGHEVVAGREISAPRRPATEALTPLPSHVPDSQLLALQPGRHERADIVVPLPALPLPSSPVGPRRVMPWASLVLLAGVVAAGLVVARHRDTRVERGPDASARALSADALAASQPAPAPSSAHEAPHASGPMARLPGNGLPGNDLPGNDLPGNDLPGNDLTGNDLTGNGERPRRTGEALRDAASRPLGSPARVASAADPGGHAQRRELRAGGIGALGSGARAPSAAPGYLTLDTTPWSSVSVEGASLGQTPLVRVELPAGQHLLELANEELGIATSVLVDITSGSTTVRRIGLEQPVHAARR